MYRFAKSKGKKKDKNSKTIRFRKEGFGTIEMAPALKSLVFGTAKLDSTYFEKRQEETQGKDVLTKVRAYDKLGELRKEKTPYGTLAMGSGIGAVASGLALYKISPKSQTVKILLGSLTALSGSASLYCTYKWNKTRQIEVGQNEQDKRLKINTDWIQTIKNDPILFSRVDEAKVKSYMKYNAVSSLYNGVSKFINFDTLQEQEKDPITNEGVDIKHESYPAWVDKTKITVGSKQFHKDIQSCLVREYANYDAPAWSSLDIEGLSHSIEDESYGAINNFGLLNRDSWITYKDASFFSCASPIIRNGVPKFYHIKAGQVFATARSGEEISFKDYYINGDNFQDWRKLDDVPSNAIIIGSRFVITSGNFPADRAKQRWQEYSRLTYDQIFSGIRFPSYGSELSIINDYLLNLRPDLWYFSRPGYPSTISTGKNTDFMERGLAPILSSYGEQFVQSHLFQPFMTNCRFMCFSKQDFIKLKAALSYQLVPLESQVAQVLRIVSIVVSVIASLVTTIVSFGSASAPAWAGTVSVIVMALTTGLNLASQYLEGGPAAFIGPLMEGISGMWDGIKSSFQNTGQSLDIHFDKSALIFANKVKDFTGRIIAPTEPHMVTLSKILGTVGNDITGNWDVISGKLSTFLPDFPDLSISRLQTIQDEMFNNPVMQETNTMFMEAKLAAENQIRSKVNEVNSNLLGYDVSKLAMLY